MSKSDKTIKRTFRLTLRAKRATVEFKEGLGVGVLASVDVTFNLPENFSDHRLQQSLDAYRQELIYENINVTAEELPNEQHS